MANKLLASSRKANCHIHLTGALTPKDILEIGTKANVDRIFLESLHDKVSFGDRWFWDASKEVTSTPIGFELSMKLVLDRELKDKTNYIEITVNPAGMLRRGLSMAQFAKILEEIYAYGITKGIQMKVNLGITRKDGVKSVEDVYKIYKASPGSIVSAIDLNGNEEETPNEVFKSSFLELRRLGVSTKVHAGEFYSLRNSILSAIEMKPTRLAHALAATKDNEILKKIKEQNIVVEISPLSGYFTGALPVGEFYPLSKFIEYDIPLVFGSDDPGVFGKNMSDHLYSLTQSGFTINQILELNKKAYMYTEYRDSLETKFRSSN